MGHPDTASFLHIPNPTPEMNKPLLSENTSRTSPSNPTLLTLLQPSNCQHLSQPAFCSALKPYYSQINYHGDPTQNQTPLFSSPHQWIAMRRSMKARNLLGTRFSTKKRGIRPRKLNREACLEHFRRLELRVKKRERKRKHSVKPISFGVLPATLVSKIPEVDPSIDDRGQVPSPHWTLKDCMTSKDSLLDGQISAMEDKTRPMNSDLKTKQGSIPSNSKETVKFTCLSSLQAINNISKWLSPAQLKLFRESCFGYFLDMLELRFCGPILHQLLLRYHVPENSRTSEDCLCFKICDKEAKLSVVEFGLITGLRLGDPKQPPNIGSFRLRNSVFGVTLSISSEELEKGLKVAEGLSDLDRVRLALLYFVETVLLGKHKKNEINMDYFKLVEDLDKFNNYPWGRVCWDRTICSFKMARTHMRSASYSLLGFPQVFQLWAYEKFPLLGETYATKKRKLRPRILNWEIHSEHIKTADIDMQEVFDRLTVQALKKLWISKKERLYVRGGNFSPIYPTLKNPQVNQPIDQRYVDERGHGVDMDKPLTKNTNVPSPQGVPPVGLSQFSCASHEMPYVDRTETPSSTRHKFEPSYEFKDIPLFQFQTGKECIKDSPSQLSAATVESCQEQTVTSAVAIEEAKKRTLLVEAAIGVSTNIDEPGPTPKKHKVKHRHCSTLFCHLEVPASLPFQDQGLTYPELTQSSPPTDVTVTPPQPNTTQPSLPASAIKSTPPLTPSAHSATSKSFSMDSYGISCSSLSQANQEEIRAVPPTSFKLHACVSAYPKGITEPRFSSLAEAHALFTEIEPMLYKSHKDIQESSQPISVALHDINQAKCFLQECLSMNFKLLLHPSRRDQLNSSLELLLKEGCFPSCVLSLARKFHVTFLRNTDTYTNCEESIERAEKKKEETTILIEKLKNNCSLFNNIMGNIQVATNKIDELTRRLAEERKTRDALEAQTKELAESTWISKCTYAHCVLDSKTLEKDKQNSEEAMAEIDALWEHFKRGTADFL